MADRIKPAPIVRIDAETRVTHNMSRGWPAVNVHRRGRWFYWAMWT